MQKFTDIQQVKAYLRHNGFLQINAENHWLHSENSPHALFGDSEIIEVLDKGLPSIFNATNHQLWFEC